LTAANIKVDSIDINGVATAEDFKLKDSIGTKSTLKQALTWIEDCEDRKIDVCMPSESSGGGGPADTFTGSDGAVRFNFVTSSVAKKVIYTVENSGSANIRRSTHPKSGRVRKHYPGGSRVYRSYLIQSSTATGKRVQWKIGNSVKWTGNLGQRYTPSTGNHTWTVSIIDGENKTVASALVRIGNGGYRYNSTGTVAY